MEEGEGKVEEGEGAGGDECLGSDPTELGPE